VFTNFWQAWWNLSASHFFLQNTNVHFLEQDMDQAINVEEQLASMKATLKRLSKEKDEKDAKIKHQDKQIIDLTKKLEK